MHSAIGGTESATWVTFRFSAGICYSSVNGQSFTFHQESTLFCKSAASGYKAVLAGIEMKTLVFGEKTLFSEFRMKAGAQLPLHSHVHEQTGYLVEGKIRLTIGDEVFIVEPGDSWCIKTNVAHRAEILADSVAIEVFSPVREDYLP